MSDSILPSDIPPSNINNGPKMPQDSVLEEEQCLATPPNPSNTGNPPIQSLVKIPSCETVPISETQALPDIIKKGRNSVVYSAEQNKTFLLSVEKVKFLAELEKNGYDLQASAAPDYLIDKWQNEDFWSLVLERMLNYAKSQELNQGLVDAFCLDVLMGRKEASDAQLKALGLAFKKFYGAKSAVVAIPQNQGPIQFNFGTEQNK